MVTWSKRRYSGLRTLLIALLVASVSGCNIDNEAALLQPQLSSPDQDRLLLEAKQALLDLDLNQLELISGRIDVNRPLPDKSTLLAWAVETQDPRFVEVLLKKGASTQTSGNRFAPMIQACRYGNSAIINALLDHGADPNVAIEDGTSAFHLCAGSASVDDLARMVSLDEKVSAENEYGQTPLMFAANSGNAVNLAYLVDLGADINKQTNEGYSPLFFAIKSQDLNAVKAAVVGGADVFARAKDGTTAPQLGVYAGNYEFLTWFANNIESFMNVAAIDSVLKDYDRNGDQLLHAAVKANQPELVSALLDLGADPAAMSEPSSLKWRYEANFKTEIYTPPQLTPIEIAEQNEFENIASVLRDSVQASMSQDLRIGAE